MTYNSEKYREKREKVLGVRRRALPFQVVAAAAAVIIISGFAVLVAPKVTSYFATRNLDDAIYRRVAGEPWPQEMVGNLRAVAGVDCIVIDKDSTRLVVTYDRNVTGTSGIEAFFREKGVEAVLLNKMTHGERAAMTKSEAEQ
ncbi:MAG: hypothetical protein JW884_01870 [Deltaproteobacteria bacterium]|nr:hypothetical protein [Deltaproteobacteria bacterium]